MRYALACLSSLKLFVLSLKILQFLSPRFTQVISKTVLNSTAKPCASSKYAVCYQQRNKGGSSRYQIAASGIRALSYARANSYNVYLWGFGFWLFMSLCKTTWLWFPLFTSTTSPWFELISAAKAYCVLLRCSFYRMLHQSAIFTILRYALV